MTLFTLFYYLFSLLLLIVATPYLILRSFKDKYKKAIPSRFFLIGNRSLKKSEKGIWFHTCSLGETMALAPLVHQLKAEYTLSVTTTTQTGFNAGKSLVERVRFLPFEFWLPFWMRPQKVLVVLEAELWYMLFFVAKFKGMKTALLNARISDKSYNKYLKMRWFYRRLFKYVDKVFCQSEIDKERLIALGARDVEVIGNIKLAQDIQIKQHLEKKCDEMIVGASTHEGEERLILEAFEAKKGTQLVMVPRHPERFEQVAEMMQNFAAQHGLTFSRYTKDSGMDTDLVLIDTIGLLIDIYAISDLVILGGAFAAIGGHNPLEPAKFGNKIISGTHYFNQKGLFPLVENLVICENDQLKTILQKRQTILPSKLSGSVDITPFYQWIEVQTKEEDGRR